jgi:hypothetical protein
MFGHLSKTPSLPPVRAAQQGERRAKLPPPRVFPFSFSAFCDSRLVKVPRSPGLLILCLFRQIHFSIKRAPPEESTTTEEDTETTEKAGKEYAHIPQISHSFTSEM